jgi:hypothetical protein
LAAKRLACGPSKTESQILSEIRKAANDVPGLILWRLSQGGAVSRNGQTYRAGLSVNGASDLIGILSFRDTGRFVAIEVKTARGTLRPEQKLFLELVRKHDGFACVCRSVDDFHAAMARAMNGARE